MIIRKPAFLSLVILAATAISTEAWTNPHSAFATTTTPRRPLVLHHDTGAGTHRSPTSLFGKKKKKKEGGGGGSATKGGAKIQVKLLQHIAGTGQAGEVILVNPVFFANKLRPQKLARIITDEEVQANLEEKQSQSEELRNKAKSLKELIDGDSDSDSDNDSNNDSNSDGDSFVLTFKDNQTGPDGKKLFGGIGPKKLMESLRKECPEFDAFSKEFTKQVSILDIEEQQQVVVETDQASEASSSKYKDYSSYSNDSEESSSEITVAKYESLPKKDKLTIKHTGIFRLKVALTKDLFARVRVLVE